MYRIKSQVDMKDVRIRLSTHVIIQRNSGSHIGMTVDKGNPVVKPIYIYIVENPA